MVEDGEDLLLEYSPEESEEFALQTSLGSQRPGVWGRFSERIAAGFQSLTANAWFRVWLFASKNKWGIGALAAMLFPLSTLVSASVPWMALSRVEVSDYVFENCFVDGVSAMCPSFKHVFWAYFRTDVLTLAPYSAEEFKDFEYAMCLRTSVPTFAANYKRHCNLLSAGTGVRVAMRCALVTLLLSFSQLIVVMAAFCKWSVWHKFAWITAALSALSLGFAYGIWALIGHRDIVLLQTEHSQVFGDANLQVTRGPLLNAILVSLWIQCAAAFSAKVFIRGKQLPQIKYQFDQLLLEPEVDDVPYSKKDLGYLQYAED